MDKKPREPSLRRVLGEKRPARLCGAFNPLSARIAQEAGFDGIWASSLEISTAYCLPDASIVSMTQFLDVSRGIRHAVSIPILVDCDTGYGDARNVCHAVRQFESSGLDGICIEDKMYPKLSSLKASDHSLVSPESFAAKIEAAASARTDSDFAIVARVEALVAGGDVNEALRRAHRYAEAGADAILVHSRDNTPHRILQFATSWRSRTPLLVVPTTYSSVTCAYLGRCGIDGVIYSSYGVRTSVAAMKRTFRAILEAGHANAVEQDIATIEQIFALQEAAGVRVNGPNCRFNSSDSVLREDYGL